MSRLASASFFLIVAASYSSAIPYSSLSSNHQIRAFVSDELVLDFWNEKDGEWLVETQSDRILFFSFPDAMENSIHQLLKDSLMIYDGPTDADSSKILYPSVEDGKIKSQFYSTGNTVFIRFRRPSDIPPPIISIGQFQLKIQKAVDCPINLGGSSSCGRVVDTVSCYCATFIARSWADTKTFCLSNSMTFLRIDSYNEDWAVYQTFGGQENMWIGASDANQEGTFKWDNGGTPISPGYTNWHSGEPSNGYQGDEDCMMYYTPYGFPWNDKNCSDKAGGICESQP